MSAPVLFDELNGLGVILLNNPKALNSLTLEMCELIGKKLFEWKRNPNIHCIFLHSVSERAFCAGGDVKSLAIQLLKNHKDTLPPQFFNWEYKTDYTLQTYPKPILCWGEGIVMGGGIGLMNGCSHRVVTESSTLAMPEITIGFFPDVGAGYFLNKLPHKLALFLAWTAARLTSADAIHLKLADFYVSSEKKLLIFDELREHKWSKKIEDNKKYLNELLENSAETLPESHFTSQETLIQRHFEIDTVEKAHTTLLSMPAHDQWLKTSVETYKKGSPTSAQVIFEQIKRARHLELKEIFVMEYNLAHHFCHNNDFAEGVRALLIDKDQKPIWNPPLFEQVDPKKVDEYFKFVPETEAFNSFLEKELSS